MEPRIQVVTHYIPSAELGLPALAVQITRLVGTYMVWVGTTDGEPEEVQNAPTQGYLGKDWACAMPPSESSNTPGAATSLYRSSASDAALTMAQRLGDISVLLPHARHTLTEATGFVAVARRTKKQIFLSIDTPPSLGSMGQDGKLLLAIERAVVELLSSDKV
ncbi:hypothetical protein C8Q74DRAFT_1367886 [Fomes fomentarius]|nr:hypothetical protein C8Q74DRAFT_1367886 [Fomes fomentarius]